MPVKNAALASLCFVIGPIGKDNTSERKHADLLLHSVIKHVLEGDEFRYKVKRADEDADPGMIGDRVVSDIIQAALVVADLTDLNPNAFYELGIRHSTELPTIHIARTGTPLPFDNVAHRTIFVDLTDWNSIEQARNRLAESARAIREPGYRVSNPITHANASARMRHSEDPLERIIADLQERLASVETTVAKPIPKSLPTEPPRERDRDRYANQLIEMAKEQHALGLSTEEIITRLKQEYPSFEEPPSKVFFNRDGALEIFFGRSRYISQRIFGLRP